MSEADEVLQSGDCELQGFATLGRERPTGVFGCEQALAAKPEQSAIEESGVERWIAGAKPFGQAGGGERFVGGILQDPNDQEAAEKRADFLLPDAS